MTQEEFDEYWVKLSACFNLSPGLNETGLQTRYETVREWFSKMRAGSWRRTVDWYIEHAHNDPWFPTPAQLFEAARQSYVPPAYELSTEP